jgi:uncharacterized membrane protein YhaH (DUF805 family)
MDSIISNFTSLEGRIGRQQWWIGVVILIVINIIISFLIMPLVGISMMPNFAALMADPNNVDPAAIAESVAATMRTAGWVSLVIFLIFLYPSAALSIKRRHDKDNSGLDVWIYFGLTALLLLLQALGLFMTVTPIPGTDISMPTPSLPLVILQIVVGIYGLYLLVVLGFLRGTAGPNQYGPDPLGGTAAATA